MLAGASECPLGSHEHYDEFIFSSLPCELGAVYVI